MAAIESVCASLCVDLGICTLGVRLVKLVIDCSSVLAVHPEVKVAQLQTIHFHLHGNAVGCTAYTLRNWDLCRNGNDVDKRRISSIHGSPYVYKFKCIDGKPNLSDQFKKIIKRYKKLDITLISCDSLLRMPGCKPNHGL